MKKFRKVHIEVTNICNLSCSFCPPKTLPNQTMNLELFEKINEEVKEFTNELAYHIVGDPLVLSSLEKYLNISLKNGLKVNITTTGNNLTQKDFRILSNDCIKQINFSINSYNANSHKKSLKEYLEPIFLFANYIIEQKKEIFINFRLWNLDETKSAKEFNNKVFNLANEFFKTSINIDEIYAKKPKSVRVARKVFFHFDEYFQWPSLNNSNSSSKGFCYGLDSHFGVLSSGVVVPCCLDKDGVINLGDLNSQKLSDILNSSRVKSIQQGFISNNAIEELCKRCEYKNKFNKRIENE